MINYFLPMVHTYSYMLDLQATKITLILNVSLSGMFRAIEQVSF